MQALPALLLVLAAPTGAGAPMAGRVAPRLWIAGARPEQARTFVERRLGPGALAQAGYLCTGDTQPLDPHTGPAANTSSFGRQGTFLGGAWRLRF